jgi:hypothetical protein
MFDTQYMAIGTNSAMIPPVTAGEKPNKEVSNNGIILPVSVQATTKALP